MPHRPRLHSLWTYDKNVSQPVFFFSNENILWVLLDFSLTVKAATLIFIFGCGSAIASAKEGKSDFIYNLVKSNKLFEPCKRACISWKS